VIQQILSIVFPVFGIVMVGYIYGRRYQPDMSAANKFNLDVFIPALLFAILSTRDFDIANLGALLIGGAAVVLLSGLLALPFARFYGWDTKTFLPPIMFNNSGNMGLPLALFAFGEKALPAAVLLFIVENSLHFLVGMKMIDRSASVGQIFKTPMLLASALGLGVSLLHIELPVAIVRPIEMIGDIAIPLMLIALGVRLTNVNLSDWKIGLAATILTPLTGLIIAIGYISLVAMPAEHVSYLILFAALPPAVLNYMIAEKYQQEPAKVASIVMLGNLGSVVVIPLVLWFILPH
jgi:predicted permease